MEAWTLARGRELDSVLQVIENPVRRKIIKRLSQEPCYALQLSKELGLGQPLVAKHLSLMEKAGLVASTLESSPSGPERKRYSLAKSISITMDVGPHLFMERASSFGASPQRRASRDAGDLDRRIREAVSRVETDGLSQISEILNDIDASMREVEQRRVELLAARDAAMAEAARIAGGVEDLDKKRVLFYILEEHDREVGSISESLNMRELVVRSILEELEGDLLG